jgi:hypothetical protein
VGVNQGQSSGPYDIALIQAQACNCFYVLHELVMEFILVVSLSLYIPAAAVGVIGYFYMWWNVRNTNQCFTHFLFHYCCSRFYELTDL